ncbi:hypothetical protein JCM10369A_09800 [Nocardioides pyridinolyticus]
MVRRHPAREKLWTNDRFSRRRAAGSTPGASTSFVIPQGLCTPNRRADLREHALSTVSTDAMTPTYLQTSRSLVNIHPAPFLGTTPAGRRRVAGCASHDFLEKPSSSTDPKEPL